MKKSKLHTPHIKEQVVKQLAVEESQSSIARQVELDQSQVSRFANREEVRLLIEEEQKRLVECVPDAVQNVKDLVREMKDIPKEDTKRRELSYKASKDVLKSTGLMPTPVQSQTLVNIFNDNRTPIISPKVMEIIGGYVVGAIGEDKEDN